MNIEEYFNEIQEFVKQNIDDKEQINNIVHSLEKDNIQAVVNQDFNNKVSIEECGKKILKQMNLTQLHTEDEPNPIAGERGMNTMERKIMNFKDFVNESLSSIDEDRLQDAIDRYYFQDDSDSIEEMEKITGLTFDRIITTLDISTYENALDNLLE